MITGAADLLESERGVACIALMLLVTVLVFFNKLTGEQWVACAQLVIGILVTSKTITSVAETVKGVTQPSSEPSDSNLKVSS